MNNSIKNTNNHIKTITAVGLFCALAYVCCVVFHFKAAFLTFDLKDAVMTVGGMIFGPLYGIAMAFIVAIIEGLTVSTTGVYGFVMNVLSSCVFVGVSSLIYKFRRTMNGAVIAITVAAISTVAVMMGANVLITPFYMNVPTADVISLIPTLLLPFNATKAVFNSAVVFIIYKPIITAMRRSGFVRTADNFDPVMSKSSPAVPVAPIALLVGAAAMIFFFVFLKGSVTIG